jgi:[protein-PII] uridylyltransferase
VLASPVSFRDDRERLLGEGSLHGDDFCRALARAADRWLGGLLEQATGGDQRGVALLAVGGYGRGELCPFSDLDVVLVHRGRRDVKGVADAVWYPVWDEGVRLDHSVRRPEEVLAVVRDDLRAQLGLLDGRPVAGDAEVVAPLLSDALELWRRRAARHLPALAEQAAERRAQHGDVAFLLEPDLKESHGGLRDVQAVRAAARGLPVLAELVDLGALEPPRRLLTAVRVELHRVTGRATDRLLLQEQDAVAAALGHPDADALMAAVAEAGRAVAWVADDVWRRRGLWEDRRGAGRRPGLRHGRGAPPRPGTSQRVEPGVVLRIDGTGVAEVALEPGGEAGGDRTLALRLAAVAAERALPIARSALDTLERSAPAPPEPWPEDLRRAFVRVLAAGAGAVAALEALDHHRLLVRLLPEWAAVRNRPQRNAYHRFTVDRHLLETAAHAAALAGGMVRPDLLLLGALFHDIGKGFPGDHSAAGVEVVGRLGRRMGLARPDVELLQALVHHHLLLADTATRRDLDDPVTIDTVAGAVGDIATLEMLAALTEADGRATGPAAWGPWKAGLVAELVRRVHERLSSGRTPSPPPSAVTDRHRQLMTQAERLGRTVVAAEAPVVTVVARDRPGLLAAVTGVLALRGLDVRSADVVGEAGFAVDTFTVEPARGRWPDWERVGDEIDAVLRGTLPLAARLAEQDRLYGRQRLRSARPVETAVTLDNAASATSTVIEVRAPDRVGLLHDVTESLFSLGLDVTAARVSTLGDEVVDAFYVRDQGTGGKVEGPERLRHVHEALRRSLEMQPTRDS